VFFNYSRSPSYSRIERYQLSLYNQATYKQATITKYDESKTTVPGIITFDIW